MRRRRTVRSRTRMSDLQTEFDRLKHDGDEHYGRKEYSIAAECYRAAMERGPGDRNLLFNFAYSLAATENDTGAAMIYQQAIQAGSGAAAHNNLGLCYRKLGKNQEARDEFVKATWLERSDALYWRNLAVCLADLKEPKAELNALEALSVCDGCTAGDWNKLGCEREREGDVEGGLVAFRNAASAAPEECAYFFNIALMHDRSGRVLDAYHACRHSLILSNGYESAAKMMPRLEKALERPPVPPPLPPKAEYKFNCPLCGQHISANESFAETRVSCPSCAGAFTAPRAPGKPREIGPHDYVNPYALLNLSAVSKLPEAFEWFDQPEDWDELLGSLTRRRRALKAELELNEGSLSWLPQLHITDEVVHRVLSNLDDSGWHPHHWAVFRLPLLNRFLMRGELDYFHSLEDAPYPLVAEIAGAAPDDFEQEEFVAFISAFFRHRWAPAIKQALDAGNYAGVSALFATSAPVTAADLDEALEPVRRHFARRRDALKQLEGAVESGNSPNLDTELQSAVGEAKLLNVLPAHLGAKLRDDMCFAYRSICIALANHRSDYTGSERALKAAESFGASETTKQRLKEDRNKLGDLLGEAAARSALQKASLAQSSPRQKSSTPSGVGWLVVLGIIVLFALISSFDSNKPSLSSSHSNSSISTPPTYTAPSTYTAPPTYTAPSSNSKDDTGTYRVPSYITSELDRDKQAIENEKAKAASLERRLDTAKQAVDTEKAKAEELENQLTSLNAQVDRSRLYLDKTSQFQVDEFNQKVNRYNAMLNNVRAENERVNQAVGSHNAILEQARAQDRVVNRMVDDYNAKLRRYGR